MSANTYLNEANRRLSFVVVGVASILLLDEVSHLVQGAGFAVHVFAVATLLAATGVVGYLWLRYVEASLGRDELKPAAHVLQLIPAIVCAVLSYASIATGWLFTIDPATGAYARGPFYLVRVLLAAGYVAIAGFLVVRELRGDVSRQRRSELLALLAFVLFPLAGTVLDSIFYGIPFAWSLCTVAIFMIYSNNQEYSISTDALTGLNNRRLFEQHATSLIGHATPEDPVFLLLIDLDRFKSINDRFGHRTGDAALKEVASLLRQVAGSRHLLIARYGGDEFAMLGSSEDPATAHTLKDDVEKAFVERNRTTDAPYALELSMGIAHSDDDAIKTVDDLVIAADGAMYREKGIHTLAARRT